MDLDAALGWIPLRWLVVLHVASAFAFVLAHAPAMVVTLALRNERDVQRVGALLDLSRRSTLWMIVSVDALGVTGALIATIEHTWARPWVWGSLVVLLVVSASMSPLAARAFNEARHAAGLPWFNGRRMEPPGEPDDAALEAALAKVRRRAPIVTAIGGVGLLLLIWLMAYRPSWP